MNIITTPTAKEMTAEHLKLGVTWLVSIGVVDPVAQSRHFACFACSANTLEQRTRMVAIHLFGKAKDMNSPVEYIDNWSDRSALAIEVNEVNGDGRVTLVAKGVVDYRTDAHFFLTAKQLIETLNADDGEILEVLKEASCSLPEVTEPIVSHDSFSPKTWVSDDDERGGFQVVSTLFMYGGEVKSGCNAYVHEEGVSLSELVCTLACDPDLLGVMEARFGVYKLVGEELELVCMMLWDMLHIGTQFRQMMNVLECDHPLDWALMDAAERHLIYMSIKTLGVINKAVSKC